MSMNPIRRPSMVFCTIVALCAFAPNATPARADSGTLVLAVQPEHSQSATRAAIRPLADYLSKVTGKHCRILTSPNFLSYWNTIHKGTGYDLAFDSSHFTDYRVKKLGFIVLVKIPGDINYSLVVLARNSITDPSELIARRIATLGIPSLDSTRLNAMFPNPMRQPIMVEVSSNEAGLNMLLQGKVAAAMLPTPLVRQAIAHGTKLSIVAVTEPIPQTALSAAPSVDRRTRRVIRKSLLDAGDSKSGRKMLQAIGIPHFDPATAAVYRGQSRVLRSYWGY